MAVVFTLVIGLELDPNLFEAPGMHRNLREQGEDRDGALQRSLSWPGVLEERGLTDIPLGSTALVRTWIDAGFNAA